MFRVFVSASAETARVCVTQAASSQWRETHAQQSCAVTCGGAQPLHLIWNLYKQSLALHWPNHFSTTSVMVYWKWLNMWAGFDCSELRKVVKLQEVYQGMMMESPLGNDDLTPAGSRSARASSQLEPAAPLLLCEFESYSESGLYSSDKLATVCSI